MAAIVGLTVVVGVGIIGYRVLQFGHAESIGGQIINSNAKCLDNNQGTLKNFNRIQLYTCNPSTAQKWVFQNNVIRMGSYCVDIPGASKMSRTNVQLYQCNGTAAQTWVRYADNSLHNPNSGLCLDNSAAATNNGNPIWIYTCNGTGAQKWNTAAAAATSVPVITPPAPVPVPQPVPAPTPAPTGRSLLNANFDNWTDGAISTNTWNAAMGGGGGTANLEDSSIVSRGGSNKAIRTFLQANTIRSIPAGNNGTAMVVPLSSTVDEATIQYDVRFNGAFDWGWGGKLPGLAGVKPGLSPSLASGGRFAGDDGWSGRIMWNTPGSYPGSAQSPNEGLLYMYGKGQVDRYGDNLWWNKSFSANTWQTIKIHYKLNTPGQSNGVLQAWLDGAAMTNRSDWNYRSTSQVRINYIYFDIFRGGATLDWAGKVDSTIDIDNLNVSTP